MDSTQEGETGSDPVQSAFQQWMDARDRGESIDPAHIGQGLSTAGKAELDGLIEVFLVVGSALGATPPSLQPALGKAGRYVKLRDAKLGGMGELYRAWDVELERDVAYKVMTGKAEAEVARRFAHEAEITARLQYPGIVPVFGRVDDDSGRPAYAMEYVDGLDLLDVIRQHSSEPPGPDKIASDRDLLIMFETACRIVGFAHSREVLHNDLSPKNLMVARITSNWSAYVVDWGLASKVGTPVIGRSTIGTPGYVAPSVGRGGPRTYATDVYSLGAILAAIVLGVRPDGRPDLESVRTDVPPPLRAIIREAMAELPGSSRPTYANASKLADEIKDYLAGEPVGAYPEPLFEQTWRKIRRRPVRATAVVVGSVVLAVASVIVAFEASRAERAERKLAEAAGNQYQSIQALSRIAADPRLAQLGLTTIQADLLDQALPPLEKYQKIVGGHEADKLLSQALTRLADVFQIQGDPEKSLGVLTTAEGYFTNIVNAGGDDPDPEAVYGLAVVRASKGAVLGRSLGRTDQAIVLLRKAAETMTRLLQAGWGKPDQIRQRLALCRNNEANCLRFSDPDAAIVAYRQAIDAFRVLAESGPGAPGASVWLVKTGSNLGLELELAGKWAEAIEVHDEFARQGRDLVARVEAERAAVADPSSNSWMLAALAIREAFAIARFNQGACLDRLGKLKDAEPVLREALSSYQGLAQQVPENREFVWSVAMTQSELGKVMTRDGLGRWEQAAGLLSQSRAWYASNDKGEDSEFAFYRGEDLIRAVDLELRRPVRVPASSPTAMELARQAVAILEKAGNGPEATMDLAEARLLLGETLARSGDDGAAGKAWKSARLGLDRLIKVSPKVPRFLLGLARVEARLGSLASREGREADAAGFRKSAQGHFEAARVESPDDPNLAEVEAELSVARPDSSTVKPAKAPG